MHLTDDEVFALSKSLRQLERHGGSGSHPHLEHCAECRESVALQQEMDEVLAKPAVWDRAAKFRSRPQRMDAFLAEVERTESQNRDAARRLQPYLKSRGQFNEEKITQSPQFHHAGVVRMLTRRAAETHERDVKFALNMATTACTIARKLAGEPRESQAVLLASALRERANALRLLGEFAKATESLDRAEAIYRQLDDSEFDLAVVKHIRGSILVQFEGHQCEARDLVRAALPVFRAYGDRKRELGALLLEAIAGSEMGEHASAAAAFERVIALSSDPKMTAHAYHNAANEYVELGDLAIAERYYVEALALRDQLGDTATKARAEWLLARVFVLRGDFSRGAKALDQARRTLLELGLAEDHALATLDWAAARLALKQPDGVATAVQSIRLRYENEGATRNAKLALAHIHEALQQQRATPALIRELRSYLLDLQKHPAAVFHP